MRWHSRPCHTQLCLHGWRTRLYVMLGRKDSLESNISSVEANMPRANTTMDEIIRIFESKNFTVGETVALSGARTIGFSHWKEFAYRLFGYSKSIPTDPSYHPKFSAALKTMCANYKSDSDKAAFNDPMTPSKFDNMYYRTWRQGWGYWNWIMGYWDTPEPAISWNCMLSTRLLFSMILLEQWKRLAFLGLRLETKEKWGGNAMLLTHFKLKSFRLDLYCT